MTTDEAIACEAIRHTIALYTRNSDSADYDNHVNVFHPDAEMSVQDGPTLNGLPAIIAAMRAGAEKRQAFAPGHFQRHHVTSMLIDITGPATATGRLYVFVVTELGFDHSGTYVDDYEKVGDRWLIRRRHASMEWGRPDSRFTAWLGKGTQER